MLLRVLLLLLLAAPFAAPRQTPGARFFKGNTHTHTLWSDGDGAPELVVDWYREAGWDFLSLTDHNVLAEGERWFPLREADRLTEARVAALVERFGEDAVELRDEAEGARGMRLVTLDQLRARFERPGEFLLITGEEVTDRYESQEVHVNGLNLAQLVRPQAGKSALDTVLRDVAAIRADAGADRPVLAHLNHPNFRWSLSAAEFASIPGVAFFEVYNGHPSVHNRGDDEHPSAERLWDEALSARLGEHGLPLLYGVATDDAHHYHDWGAGKANPGRGWVMVRADELDADRIVEAMQTGDFYASSGVVLRDFHCTPQELRVEIEAEEGVEYTTRFIGSYADDERVGRVLATVVGPIAELRPDPDLLYVRAEVHSSRPHPNPSEPGEVERAWLQPVVVGGAGR